MECRMLVVGVVCLLLQTMAGPLRAAPDAPPAASFDIPRLTGITVDGDPSDWQARGFQADAFAPVGGPARPATSFDAAARLGWDERGLLVLVTVRDTTPNEQDANENYYERDSIEMFVAGHWGASAFAQAVFSPGFDPRHATLRSKLFALGLSASPVTANPAAAPVAASRRIEGGYVIEALLPWPMVTGHDHAPTEGDEIAANLLVNDTDLSNVRARAAWYPTDRTNKDPHLMYRLRLSTAASPPQRVAASGVYERFRRVALKVTARTADETTPSAVEVREGERVLARGTMPDGTGRRETTLDLPMPVPGTSYSPLTVTVAGQAASPLLLPDANTARREAFEAAEFGAQPFVFSGAALPPCDFSQPNYVEDLAGRYTVETKYFDAAGNPVTSAAKPGRYGAVCTVNTAAGWTATRYLTLFRTAARIDWEKEMAFHAVLPPELGLEPAIITQYPRLIADELKYSFADGFARRDWAALTLAALSEMTAGEPDIRRNSPARRNQRWWYALQRKLGRAVYPHRVELPPTYDTDPARRWPLIVLLHGSGDRGSDLATVDRISEMRRLHEDHEQRFVFVTPLCPARERWNPDAVVDLIHEIEARYRIDPAHIYLMGVSMGGIGTWDTATEHPDEFAAIAPYLGFGDPKDVAPLADLPCWAFHGDKDPLVPFAEDAATVDALKRAGGRVRFTVYRGFGHEIPDPGWHTGELYEWFLRQTRGKPEEPKAVAH